jgi:hypothetical protein
MRKFGILVASALVMGLSFTSCGSDDDSNNSSIVGKWNFSTAKYTVNGTVTYNGPYDDNEVGCAADNVELFANGTALETDYFNSDCDFDTYPSTYTRNGNTLTVTDDGDVNTLEILELTSNKLVLRSSYTFEGETEISEITFIKA